MTLLKAKIISDEKRIKIGVKVSGKSKKKEGT